MGLNPEVYYRQLGRHIETWPLILSPELSAEQHQWLGRADALIALSGDVRDTVDWRFATSRLNTANWHNALEDLKRIMYRVLASAELNVPVAVAGAFIPVGSTFDAYAAISKLLQTASKDVLVVDPYMDDTVLTQFGGLVEEGVSLRLLTSKSSQSISLVPASKSWTGQHGAKRPLSVRLATSSALHDRAIFIDDKTAWTITQSLRDIAKRSPAEIVRVDDIAAMKIEAYKTIWDSSEVVI